MKCARTLSLAAALVLAGTVSADQLAGTMNFANVTDSKVNQTTPENNEGNEKHVELGDFDEDGDLDVIIGVALSDLGARRNKLYQNDGGVLNEVTDSGIIPGFTALKVTRNVFFRDFTGDGHLDIYVINDQNSHSDQFFVGEWDGGAFQSFAEDNQRLPSGGDLGAACSGVAEDFDNDGDYEVYSGNYPNSSQDRILDNDGTGFFDDMTNSRAPQELDYTVDVSAADLNGDGRIDLILSNGFFDQNKIYYNNKNDEAGFTGDYKYGASGNDGVQNLGQANSENAMEPGDFDGDGDLDIYWSDRNGDDDRILRNDGVDANGMVIWTELNILPFRVSNRASRKAEVADLNGDGRPDIVVTAESRRLAILRNTSVDGGMSFIEWTPGSAFPPEDESSRGWHSVIFDANGDGRNDILTGGWNDDHLFESTPSNEIDAASIPDGVLPALFNMDPIAIYGEGSEGMDDTYTMSDEVSAGTTISLIVNGPDDYRIAMLGTGGGPLAAANRGGLGVEEALSYFATSPGAYGFRIMVLESAGGSSASDIDNDGNVGATDLAAVLAAWGKCLDCAEDVNGDGVVNFGDLVIVLGDWGPAVTTNEYTFEILTRSE